MMVQRTLSPMLHCYSNILFVSEQKWSKGKVRDKLNNLVLFDKATYDKLYKEVPNYKLITPAVVSERLKIRGSLARNALQELLAKGISLSLSYCCMTTKCISVIISSKTDQWIQRISMLFMRIGKTFYCDIINNPLLS